MLKSYLPMLNDIFWFVCNFKVDGCAQIWAHSGDKVFPDQESTSIGAVKTEKRIFVMAFDQCICDGNFICSCHIPEREASHSLLMLDDSLPLKSPYWPCIII
ncbi:hypothetical protein P8452_44446 [Trifolium repens]|nr:hypothetical protein P8452_44446 [Trifolium repens]